MKRIKKYLINIGILLAIGIVMYKGCSVDNEYGFLGFDKMGRQIYIQSLNHYFQGRITVESEFFDRNILLRFLKEPLRTTLRFRYNFLIENYLNLDIFGESISDSLINDERLKQEYKNYIISETEKVLNEPVDNILSFFDESGEIYLTEETTIKITELRERVSESECKTVEDFYKGLGFELYEVFVNDEKYYSKKLKHWKKREN